jgi:hypothetical protein
MSALLAWIVCLIVVAHGSFAAPAWAFARRVRSAGLRATSGEPARRREEYSTPRPRPPDPSGSEADMRDPDAYPARLPGRNGGPIGPGDDPGRAP